MRLFSLLGGAAHSRQVSRSAARRSRRHARAFDLAALESRELLAAGSLGINLAGTLGFVDLMKETRAWTPLSTPTLTSDANGWPQQDAQIVVTDERVNQWFNGPDPVATQPDIGGTYHLSFQGSAAVASDWPNNFTVQNQVYNQRTNTTTADLVVPHNANPILVVDFRNTVNTASATGTGVANVKLIQPGYAADTTQVFTNTMLNDLAPFTALRYLNIDQANNYQPTEDANGKLVPLDWSQRKLPSAASQLAGSGQPGEAWEYMIALANATNTDMWINIPAPASDAYVTQLANLIKNGDTVNGVTYAGLNSNLKVYLEFSNEVWGGSNVPYAYNMESAKEQVLAGNSPLNNDGSTDQGIWAQRNYLTQTMRITNIFRSVLGADPTYAKIRPVLGWAEGYYPYYTSTFAWFEKTFGTPGQYFYGLGDAIYDAPTDYSSVTNLFASLTSGLAIQATQTAQFATVAKSYGMQVVAYEGGPDAGSAPNAAGAQVALAANRDPRMEAFVQQEYDTFYAAGGNLAMFFDGPYDNWTPNNQYSALEVAEAGNPTASPKYRGLVDLSQASPQATTAGALLSTTATTALVVQHDDYGLRVPNNPGTQPDTWLVNAPTAGNYTLSIQTGSGSGTQPITVSLSDTDTIGTFVMGSQATYNLTTLALHAGLNSLTINNLGGFLPPQAITLTPASLTTGLDPILLDYGFEEGQQNSGSLGYAFDPTGTPWTYTGTAGVASNASSLTSKAAAAPQGTQVGFVQNTGSISQTVTGLVAGSYRLSFSTAQGSAGASQSFQVLVDGASVGTYNPVGSTYHLLSTPTLTLGSGTHTITFQGLNATSGAAALLDDVALVAATAQSATGTNFTLLDPSFEATALPGTGYSAFVVAPTNSPWNFSGTAGISGNGSGFTSGNPNAPDGMQVGYVDTQGAFRQSITNTVAGDYAISFDLAQRGNAGVAQTVQVWVDGTPIATFTPASTAYQVVKTPNFYLPTGSHLITFQGLDNGVDGTAFIDNVSITQDSTTPNFNTLGFSSASTLASGNGYQYAPQDTAWLFSGGSGVTGNNTAFTNGNAAPPQGQQVAFLQHQGSVSQTINWAAGSYTIGLEVAQRANFGLSQGIQVLIDGMLVGTFAPSGSSYQAVQTASFTVTTGTHTITIQGMRSTGDGTAFVTGLAVAPSSTPAPASTLGFSSTATLLSSPGYLYQPQDTSWTFRGGSGVTGNNTAFTNGNAAPPQGQQVAFLQNQGSVSQTTNWSAGTYSIGFELAQRANFGSAQVVQVLVDGVLVGTFAPTGNAYQAVQTASFAVTTGTHTITIQGMRSTGDGTAFVSGVNINQSITPAVASGLGFDSAATLLNGSGYLYGPQDTSWTFRGGSGVTGNNTAFTNGNAAPPQGQQVAFLQNQGSVSQTTNWSAGSYTIGFELAQRANFGSAQVVQVLVDGVLVGTFAPTGNAYQAVQTASFAVTAGTHTIIIQGTRSTGDGTAFVSGVVINQS